MASFSSPAERQPVAATIADAQRFRKLAANLPGVIYTYVLRVNGSDSFTYLSDNLRELFEIEPAAAMRNAEVIWKCLHPEDLDRLTETVANSAKELIRWQAEWRIITPSGQLKWLSGVAQPEQQADGTVVWDGIFLDISDRKQAEEQQRQSEQRYRALARNFPNGMILIFDRDHRYTLVDGEPELAAIGMSPTTLLGKTPPQILPPEPANTLTALYRRVLRGAAVEQEFVLGDRVYALHCVPLRDEAGEITSGLVVAQNITERKGIEAELRQTAERLQEAQRIAHLGHWDLDAATGTMTWSPEMFRIFGLDPQQGVPSMKEHLAQIHPEDREHHQQALTRLLAGTPTEIEFRTVAPSGAVRYLNVRAEPIFSADGQPQRYIGTTMDITERKQAELTQQENAELFRAIFDQAAIGLCYVELDGRFSRVNVKLCEILGHSEAELLQLTFEDITHPEDISTDFENLERVALGELSRFVTEKRFRRADGAWVWTNASISVVRSATGAPRFFIGALEDISDRRAAQQRAQELLAILEVAPDLIGSTDLAGNVTYLNLAYRRWFNLGPTDSLQSFTISDFHPPAINEFLAQTAIPSAIARGSWIGETELRRPNGDIIPASQAIIAHYDDAGKVQYLSTIIRDISAAKQAERQLREQAILLRAVLDSIPQAVFWKDRHGIYLGCNQRFATDAGFRHPTEVMGRDDTEMPWHEEAASHYQEHDRQVLESGQGTLGLEEPITFADGGQGWLATSKVPLLDSEGSIIGVLGVYEDITERKAMEAALRERIDRETLFNDLTNQIRNSLDVETILATAVHALRDLLDIDRSYISWYCPAAPEPYWETTQESKREDLPSLMGRVPQSTTEPAADILLQGQTLRVDAVDAWPEATLQDILRRYGYTSFLAVPLATASDRQGVWIVGHCHGPRPWTDGEVELMEMVAGQMAIALNQAELYEQAQSKTRELEQAYHELQQTQSQLIQSEKMSSLGQLVAGVAHEINNPVNFIYGNLAHANDYLNDLISLLEQYKAAYPHPTPELAETIEAIDLDFLLSDLPKLFASMRVGADRIKEIVKSLRTFSRLDEADMKAVDLHESLESTLMILQNRLKAKSDRPAIQVVQNYSPLPKIDCYAGQLNQVFMNLISNAIDAMEERHKQRPPEELEADPGCLWITTAVVDNQARITIRDNGTGIPADKLGRIFDPFYTTKAVGKGTGLGLSISYQIVTEKHRGRLYCASQLGQGTEFVIEIPLSQPDLMPS